MAVSFIGEGNHQLMLVKRMTLGRFNWWKLELLPEKAHTMDRLGKCCFAPLEPKATQTAVHYELLHTTFYLKGV
jgi:hypothetical protein